MERYDMPTKIIQVQTDPSEPTGAYQDSPRDQYVIRLNDPEANAARGYPTNYIRTTKYTLLTFIPKNLFEQFRRLSNFYFLTVVIVQLIPAISPLIPITSILPLVFVLCVTALKEAVEDYYRHQADKKNNNEQFSALRDGELVEVRSKDLKAGDIVYVAKNQSFPSDLILLSSSLDEGICYVETANLDGETNLKLRKSLDITAKLQSAELLASLQGAIHCESPNERLYQFSGRMVVKSHKGTSVYSLGPDQLLHRSAKLRNTAFIYGLIVYAGEDTKLFLNQQPPPSKFSNVEHLLNRFILGIFIFQMLCCLAMSVLSAIFQDNSIGHTYLGTNDYSTAVFALRNFFTYFVLFNTMIPISLWVTLELVKVGQARFMSWDEHMALNGVGMQPKTSNLNEDLGRIEHIFSDKTGTLTENMMKFSRCSVNGIVFDERKTPAGMKATALDESTPEAERKSIREFLQVMSLCHSVVPEIDDSGKIEYNSQSPDETALLDTARDNGYVFLKKKSNDLVVEELGEVATYKVLAVLEFTSARRRMSIIIETEDGRIMLLCKGADLVVSERLSDGNDELKDVTAEHLKAFSKDGLRTLMFAHKELLREEYDNWKDMYLQATTSIENREDRVEATCEIIENDLTLLGCTAIEDKLQDEVPETIHYLLECGIQLWVLTGDKQETAINIGYSSRLLTPDMDLIIINADNSESCGDQLRVALEKFNYRYYNAPEVSLKSTVESEDEPKLLGMVIDGHTLGFALHDHVEAFLALGKACRSVICCRVTPLQKAHVVRVVKQGEQRISCAIGDGANDVSMIQEAHVGIGIFGKEGTQAALASDYAIYQFRHLKRLLAIHGRYSYIRVTGVILYSFYKNLSFTTSMLFFSFYNGFTGQTLYSSWIITAFNIIFTSVPPLLYGLFERDINDDVLYKHAETYREMQKGKLFTLVSFSTWVLSAMWHAVVTYYGVYLLFQNEIIGSDGKDSDLWTFGTIASTASILIVNFRIVLEQKTWTILNHIGIWGSMLTYFLVLLCLSGLKESDLYYIGIVVLGQPSFYFTVIILIVVALLPDFFCKFVKVTFWPSDWQILRERYSMPRIYKEVMEFVPPASFD